MHFSVESLIDGILGGPKHNTVMAFSYESDDFAPEAEGEETGITPETQAEITEVIEDETLSATDAEVQEEVAEASAPVEVTAETTIPAGTTVEVSAETTAPDCATDTSALAAKAEECFGYAMAVEAAYLTRMKFSTEADDAEKSNWFATFWETIKKIWNAIITGIVTWMKRMWIYINGDMTAAVKYYKNTIATGGKSSTVTSSTVKKKMKKIVNTDKFEALFESIAAGGRTAVKTAEERITANLMKLSSTSETDEAIKVDSKVDELNVSVVSAGIWGDKPEMVETEAAGFFKTFKLSDIEKYATSLKKDLAYVDTSVVKNAKELLKAAQSNINKNKDLSKEVKAKKQEIGKVINADLKAINTYSIFVISERVKYITFAIRFAKAAVGEDNSSAAKVVK